MLVEVVEADKYQRSQRISMSLLKVALLLALLSSGAHLRAQSAGMKDILRVGVVAASRGETQWMKVPAYPNENYIPRMEWTKDSESLILEHFNRLQNKNDVLSADARTGTIRSIYQNHDSAWVDIVDDLKWVHRGKDFLWLSEQDGWRHIYQISLDGKALDSADSGRLRRHRTARRRPE